MSTHLSESSVVRLVKQAERRSYMVFLGAGASYSSGIPLASHMIAEWRTMAHRESGAGTGDFEAFCRAQPWYGAPDEYSRLFEALFPKPVDRQRYLTEKIEARGVYPGWGYLLLGNLMREGVFNVCLTTNFDDLLNDALTYFFGYNAVVCAWDAEVENISLTSERAKILKLHGDFLFDRLRNTTSELRALSRNMRSKVEEFAGHQGLIAIGYSGGDQSIMDILSDLLAGDAARGFRDHGVYWGVRPGDTRLAPRVQQLAERHPEHFRLFECADFDRFMAALHAARGLELPASVLRPYEALRARFERLLRGSDPAQPQGELLTHYAQTVAGALEAPWAQAANEDELTLLQGQLALGRRDAAAALTAADALLARQPGHAAALTVRGEALALLADAQGDDRLAGEATRAWAQAIEAAPDALPPRYRLFEFLARRRRVRDAIEIGRALVARVPGDRPLRETLTYLLLEDSQLGAAQAEADRLVQEEPHRAKFHLLRANVLERRGLASEALDAHERAVALDPNDPVLHFRRGMVLTHLLRSEDAFQAFERAVALDPASLTFRVGAAQAYLNAQRPDLARPHLETAVTREPGSTDLRGQLCQVYAAVGDYARAEREIHALLQAAPQDARAFLLAGLLYLQANAFGPAEQRLRQAQQLNPREPRAYGALLELFRAQGRFAEAHWAQQALMQLGPAGAARPGGAEAPGTMPAGFPAAGPALAPWGAAAPPGATWAEGPAGSVIERLLRGGR